MEQGQPGPEGQGSPATQPPAAATQTPPAQAPEGFVETARLNGALKKIQELTLANQTLTEQLAAKEQSLGSFQAQLAQKEAEWQSKAGEFAKQLEAANTEKSSMQSKLSAFDAMQLKMKIIAELNQPALYNILDVIPNEVDEAALRQKISGLATFAQDLMKKRETELVAGVLPVVNPQNTQVQLPTSEEGWQSYINSFPLGSPERQQAFDAWHAQLFKSQP